MKDQWSGTLVMILQPGEETGEGAKAMLDDGLYTRFPKPELRARLPRRRGASGRRDRDHSRLCARQRRQRRHQVKGVGGHGAYPHTTRDPIVLASRIVTTLQTLVSRENDPPDPAVVTVGSFQAGAKHNIISDEAKLQLTVRSYTPEVRKLLLDGIRADRPRRGDRGRACPRTGCRSSPSARPNTRRRPSTPRNCRTARSRCSPQHFGAERAIKTAGGDGRRGFQPLLARRQVDREPDLLGRRHAARPMGRGRRRHRRSCRRCTARSGRPTRRR